MYNTLRLVCPQAAQPRRPCLGTDKFIEIKRTGKESSALSGTHDLLITSHAFNCPHFKVITWVLENLDVIELKQVARFNRLIEVDAYPGLMQDRVEVSSISCWRDCFRETIKELLCLRRDAAFVDIYISSATGRILLKLFRSCSMQFNPETSSGVMENVCCFTSR